MPNAEEVAPWVAIIERLWDDPDFEAEHRRPARLRFNDGRSTARHDNMRSFFRRRPQRVKLCRRVPQWGNHPGSFARWA